MENSIDSSDNEIEIKKRTMSLNKKFPEFENEEGTRFLIGRSN